MARGEALQVVHRGVLDAQRSCECADELGLRGDHLAVGHGHHHHRAEELQTDVIAFDLLRQLGRRDRRDLRKGGIATERSLRGAEHGALFGRTLPVDQGQGVERAQAGFELFAVG